jgi:AcrR family transcriptional regulator
MGKSMEVYEVLGEQYQIVKDGSENSTKQRILLAATELFAKRGYSTVSVRDIGDQVGVTAAALYNHFSGKEVLWKAIIDQAAELYVLYFKRLAELVEEATSFREILDLVFLEPCKMDNVFTNYAFSIIATEQFRDRDAGEIFEKLFLKMSVDEIDRFFKLAIEKGYAKQFETRVCAQQVMHSVIVGITVNLQVMMGYNAPYSVVDMLAALKENVYNQGALD